MAFARQPSTVARLDQPSTYFKPSRDVSLISTFPCVSTRTLLTR